MSHGARLCSDAPALRDLQPCCRCLTHSRAGMPPGGPAIPSLQANPVPPGGGGNLRGRPSRGGKQSGPAGPAGAISKGPGADRGGLPMPAGTSKRTADVPGIVTAVTWPGDPPPKTTAGVVVVAAASRNWPRSWKQLPVQPEHAGRAGRAGSGRRGRAMRFRHRRVARTPASWRPCRGSCGAAGPEPAAREPPGMPNQCPAAHVVLCYRARHAA